MRLLVIGVIGIATLKTVAEAAPPPPDDTVRPGFMLMDVDGDHSQVELDSGLTFATGDGGGGVLWSPRIRVQGLVAPQFGLYGALQAAVFSDDGSAGVSNPELGVVYHARVRPDVDLSAHLGAVLGLHDGGPDLAVSALVYRPADLVIAADNSWVRAGASGTYRGGGGFARLDAGVDKRLGGHGSTATLVHLDAGLGVGNAEWSAAAELQVVIPDGAGSPDSVQTVGLSLHHHGSSISPYGGVVAPIGNGFDFDLITLVVGASFAL